MPYTAKPRLADPNAEKWYRAMSRKSQITADVNYRRLRAFCEQMGLSPADVLRRARRQTEVRDLLGRFVEMETEKGRAAWYIHSSVIAVKSWLKFNDRPLTLQVELPSNTVSKRREDERVPTSEELRSILLAAKPHERAVVVLMAHSGLRPGAIGSYEGNDGLRLKDLPDLHYRGDGCRSPKPELHHDTRVAFDPVPARVRVRTGSSKGGHQYLSFLGEEACGYLVQYLEQRMAHGEVLRPDTGVAKPRYGSKQFVRSLNISSRVRRLFKAAGVVDASGVTPRPYVLRQYFLNRCLEAQSRTGVPDRFVEHWGGHRGDVTAKYYTTGLPHMPDSLVEEMRAAYRKCEPFLSTTPGSSRASSNAEAFKVMLSPFYTDEEIGKIDLTDTAAVIDAYRSGAARKMAAAGPPQRIVARAEAERLVLEGWKIGRDWEGGRVVVERAG
ncbi:MAG TPA: site-specific integrase [Thermoplasmata archaeon]|nr:site-specific integrase [Thermoplasmata archaeon]